MTHAVRVKRGSASYSNNYIRTHRWQREQLAGWAFFLKVAAVRFPQPSISAVLLRCSCKCMPQIPRHPSDAAAVMACNRMTALLEQTDSCKMPF